MDPIYDFSYFPILETKRCRLRQLTPNDGASVLAIFGDPEVTRYMDDEEPYDTLERAIGLINLMNAQFDKQNGLRWGITLQGDDTVIGTCGFHLWSRRHRRTDIGYDLAKAYWGQGYITEVTHAMVRWCFDNLHLHRVQADCTAGNIGSERVLEKVGFTFEGIWRENTFEHGGFVSLKQYGLLRREYLPTADA